MNIKTIIDYDLCSGCGACSIICPKEAISIYKSPCLNKPAIDMKLCINCHKCINICPGYKYYSQIFLESNSQKINFNKNFIKGSICYSSDIELRKQSSSGGYITSLLVELIKRKEIDGVITLKNSNENLLEYEGCLITNFSDLLNTKGSKYHPVSVCEGLKYITDIEGKFVFVGKPCDIYAAKLLGKKNSKLKGKIILFISIFCNHTPCRDQLLKLLKDIKINSTDIQKIYYRGNGWPGEFKIIGKNEQILFSDTYRNIWDNYFCDFIPTVCQLCDDPFGNESDISVGDAWGYKDESNLGYSAVFLNTQQGIVYHNLGLQNDIIIEKETIISTILNGQESLVSRQKLNYLVKEAFFLNKRGLLDFAKFFLLKNNFSLFEKIQIIKLRIRLLLRR